MNIELIEKYYPKSFTPLEYVKDRTFWIENEIYHGTCSAFSKFFNTYQEVVENIDNLNIQQKNFFRLRFMEMLLDLKETQKVYYRVQNEKVLKELLDIKIEDIILFTEKRKY